MLDKTLTAAAVVGTLRDGMTIGIGGWGPRRKPMALVRALLRSPLRELTVIAYGGPEVGMLCAAGKIKKLIYGFVSLDAIPVEPWFRRAREAGSFEARELDEGLLQWGLRAAAMRVPFLPTPVGLASDVMRMNPEFRTVRSPMRTRSCCWRCRRYTWTPPCCTSIAPTASGTYRPWVRIPTSTSSLPAPRRAAT